MYYDSQTYMTGIIGNKGNVLPAIFRINSLVNKHDIRKHVIYEDKFFSTHLLLCLKTLSFNCCSLDQTKQNRKTKNEWKTKQNKTNLKPETNITEQNLLVKNLKWKCRVDQL